MFIFPGVNSLLTVSQEGLAMDLDFKSCEEGLDEGLMSQAKNPHHFLEICYRCKKSGGLAINHVFGEPSKVVFLSIEKIPDDNEG